MGLGLGLEEVFVFDSKSENRDRSVESVLRLRLGLWLGLGSGLALRGCCVCGSVAEGGGRGATSGLWLEGRLCSMLTVMLGGDLDVATWV